MLHDNEQIGSNQLSNPSLSKKPYIICFGDSLTVGFQSPTPECPEYRETPYGAYLQDQMGPDRHVVVSGMNGELTGQMVERFTKDVVDWDPQYVIILGGTNDLGWNYSPSEIFHNLGNMYDQAQSNGITPIAVTVPSLRRNQMMEPLSDSDSQIPSEAGLAMINSLIERRIDLNGQIQDYCLSKNIPWVDLFTDTADLNSKLLATQYSNDGLHFSSRGYKRLADLLWTKVLKNQEW